MEDESPVESSHSATVRDKSNVVQVEFEGKREDAIEVDFDTEKEGWAVFILPDGTVIKLKNVVSRICRLLNKTRDDGSPIHILEGQALVTSTPAKSQSEEL